MSGRVGLAVLGLGRRGAAKLRSIMTANEGRMDVRWIIERDEEAAKMLASQGGSPAVAKPWHWDAVCEDDKYV